MRCDRRGRGIEVAPVAAGACRIKEGALAIIDGKIAKLSSASAQCRQRPVLRGPKTDFVARTARQSRCAVPSLATTSSSTTSRGFAKTSPQRHHRGSRCGKGKAMTTNRIHFYGDASLQDAAPFRALVYAPERNGVPVYMCKGIRASFGANMNATTSIFSVGAVRPEHRVCREREFGNDEHHPLLRVPGTNQRASPLARRRSPTPRTTRRSRVGTTPATCAAARGRCFGSRVACRRTT